MHQDPERIAVLRDRKRIARRLSKLIPAIVDQWTLRLQAQVDAAMSYKRSVLVDSMPRVLEHLVRALARGGWNYPDCEGTDMAFVHGKQRESLLDYDLSQVVDEYALLRSILMHALMDDATTQRTREFIHQYLDANVRAACVAFATRKQQRVTRHLVKQRNYALRERMRAKRALVVAKAERDSIAGQVERLNTDRLTRSRMIAILGHDMRAPLTAVQLQAQRIEGASDAAATAKIQSLAQRITHGVKRIDEMIGSLIEADRVEAAEQTAMRVDFGDLADIVRRGIKTVADAQESRFVTSFNGATTGHWDVAAVLRAVENLCSNAIKYGSHDAAITVSVAAAGACVRVAVHNHGSYLTPQERRGLFKAYFRREQDKTARRAGWGLGLAQVKQAAGMHGGQVTIHSKARAGTAFCLHMLRDCRSLEE